MTEKSENVKKCGENRRELSSYQQPDNEIRNGLPMMLRLWTNPAHA